MQIPNFLIGQPLDFAPVQNALGAIQKQRQFEAQNLLAQQHLGINQQQLAMQQAAAGRSEADWQRQEQQRQEMKGWLGNGVPNVPGALVDMSRISGDASPVKDYILAEAKRRSEGQYGKQGAAYFDPATGRSYTIQFGANGERRILPVEVDGAGLNPDKGIKTVDTGTGTRVIDAARGRDVREIGKDIAGRESQEKQGQAKGQAIVDLPRKQAAAQSTLDLVDKIIASPGTKGNFGTAGIFPNMPGGAAANAAALIDQIKSRAFLEAFNGLRGGGAITEAEGQKATTALIRAQNAQSYEAFLEALADFKYQVQTGMELARRAAGVGGPNGNMGMDAQGGSFRLPPGYSIRKVDD